MISVLLKTYKDLGDHGEGCTIALKVDENATIKELVDKALSKKFPFDEGKKDYTHDEHLEIRVCKG